MGAHEARLRRLAQQQGLALTKDRKLGYLITDPDSNTLLFGGDITTGGEIHDLNLVDAWLNG
jgi:hypothetical protein